MLGDQFWHTKTIASNNMALRHLSGGSMYIKWLLKMTSCNRKWLPIDIFFICPTTGNMRVNVSKFNPLSASVALIQKPPSYRNQPIDLHSKSIDWFYMGATLELHGLSCIRSFINASITINQKKCINWLFPVDIYFAKCRESVETYWKLEKRDRDKKTLLFLNLNWFRQTDKQIATREKKTINHFLLTSSL